MAKKKTAKNKNLQVQKQKIAARLLEINFKADDYIYKRKAISLEHAQKYLEEVEKFKPKCLGDDRSLQVIEKLTHLMKSIIEQGKTSQGASQSSYNPLNITTTNTLDTTIKSTRSIQVQTHAGSEIGNILDDLGNNDCDKNIEESDTNLINDDIQFNLERTLSNLSLSIIDPANKFILENNNQLSEVDNINLQYTQNNSLIFYENETNVSSSGNFYQVSKDQKQKANDTEKFRIQCDKNAETCKNYIIIDLDEDNSVGNKSEHNKISILEDKVDFKHINNKTKIPDMEVEKSVGPKKTRKPTDNNSTKPKRARRKSKVKNPEDMPTDKSNNRRRKKEVLDLSWIENMKFVRIIEPSEYTSFNLPDSFWDHCYLPHDFSQYF